MKICSICKKCVSLALTFAFIFALAFPLTVYGGETAPFVADFGVENGNNNVTLKPSELLCMLYGEQNVSEGEREYADTYFENVLIYAADIYADSVDMKIADGKIEIAAKQKSFKTNNGYTLLWTPAAAYYNGMQAELSKQDEYRAEFDFCDGAELEIKYTATLVLPDGYIDQIANFAFADKTKAEAAKAQYEQLLAQYRKKNEEYTNYLNALKAHEAAERNYEEYLRQKQEYEERLAKYLEYINVILPKYEKEKAAYDAYVAEKKKYDIAKAEYDKNYEKNLAEFNAYKAYLANLDKIRASMAAIESIYVTPSNGVGPLFGALQNAEIISMIEKNQNTLVNMYGVKRSDIADMRKASNELMVMLTAYGEARKVSEEAAFAYYKQHYADITQRFNYMYAKMRAVLNDTIFSHVCSLFEIEYENDPEMAKYKIWRTNNVLCHIYLICNVLDDSKTAGTEWEFYQRGSSKPYKYLFSDLLAQNVIIADTNTSSPASLNWISGNFTVTQMPSPPVPPATVMEPTAPTPVEEPTAPTEVLPAGEVPTPVEPPAEVPTPIEPELVARTDKYLGSSNLGKRELPQSRAITLKKTLVMPVSDEVIYCNYDGTVLSYGEKPEEKPTREATEQYNYEFSGEWEKRNNIYIAKYNATERQYTAIFKHNGDVLYTTRFYYSEKPEYKGDVQPTREPTDTEVFTLGTWVPAGKNGEEWEYNPQFIASARFYEVSWDILGEVRTSTVEYQALQSIEMPAVATEQYIGLTHYKFVGWTKTVAQNGDVTYTADFKKTLLASLPETVEGELDVYIYDKDFIVQTDSENVSLGGVIKLAERGNNRLVVRLPSLTLTVDSTATKSLAEYGAHSLQILRSKQRADAGGVGYVFADKEGNSIRFEGAVTLTLENTLGVTDNLYIKGTHENGAVEYFSPSASVQAVELAAKAGVLYTLHRYYSLNITAPTGGAVFSESTLYRAGDTVKLDIRPNAEYKIGSISLVGKSTSTTLKSSERVFVMPEEDLSLSVEFVQKLYTVSFVVDGQTVQSTQHAFGEKVTPPEVPLTFEKEGFIYSFIGWSQTIGTVTGDITYTAKYVSVRADLRPQLAEGSAMRRVILEQVIPIACLLVVLGGAITLLCIVSTKAHKRSKSKKKGKGNE